VHIAAERHTLARMNAFEKNPNPQAIEAAFRNAEQLGQRGHHAHALEIYQQIVKAKPRWPFGYYGLGTAYEGLSKFEDARRNLRKAIELKDNHAAFHAKLAEVLNWLDDQSNAMSSIDRALELDPDKIEYLVNKATIMRFNGDLKGAYNLLEPSVLSGESTDLLIRVYAKLCGALGEPNKGIEALEPLSHTVNSDPLVTATHMFVLAHLYNQIGDFDLAFKAAARGSELRSDVYKPEQRVKLLNDRVEAWSKDRICAMPRSRVNSDKPVFIVGMPRSGTTLIEQIIAAHPDAYGCGELIGLDAAANEIASETPESDLSTVVDNLKTATLDRTARKVLKAMEKQVPKGEKPKRITDKLPLNLRHLGLIEVLFPNARVIHIQRHVLDNFVSCYLLDFAGVNNHAYTYDPNHFAHFYSLYLRYMEHWKSACTIPILDIGYEETVADQRGATERILEFLDLEWDDRCMSFFEAKRAVNTASVEQVRKPIYTSSSARWKNFENHLTPVIEALRENGVEIK